MTNIMIIKETAGLAVVITVMFVQHAKGPTQKINTNEELLVTHLQLEVNKTGSSTLNLYCMIINLIP